jgi:hypothetical protein
VTRDRAQLSLAVVGLLLAFAAPVAAPSTTLLPAPSGVVASAAAGAVLASLFLFGLARPVWAFFALIALVVLEGAIRRWVVNGLTVFLAKDFVALGLYAAILPRLRREEWRRPWWLLAPLGLLLALALVHVARSGSASNAIVGLRSYTIYVPLLWAAPAIVDTRRRAYTLVGLVLTLGAGNAVFSVVQARSGDSVLNKLVSGSQQGLITLQGAAYIRPAGTFMQTGVMAAWLFLTVVVALGVLIAHRRGRWLAAGLAAISLVAWGVVYASARSLLGSVLLVCMLAVLVLIARRRVFTAGAIPAAFATGLVLAVWGVPWTQEQGAEAVRWVDSQYAERVQGRPSDEAHGRGSGGAHGRSSDGAHGLASDDDAAPGRGFLRRAADFNKAGGEVGLWSDRIKPQFELISKQRLVGRGTGTMTLGSGYGAGGSGESILQGEGMYTKTAWELGLFGLAAFVWFALALAVVSILGVLRSEGWRRMLALAAAGATLILPLWYLLTFALDFPVVAILVYVLAGCASSYACAVTRRSSSSNRAAIISHDSSDS